MKRDAASTRPRSATSSPASPPRGRLHHRPGLHRQHAYLASDERRRVVQLAVAHAGDVPVLAGVGATRTRDVLRRAEQRPGGRRRRPAAGTGVLPAALRRRGVRPLRGRQRRLLGPGRGLRQPRHDPLHVQRRPARTHRRPPQRRVHQDPARWRTDPAAMQERVDTLRSEIPADVTIGISGDYVAARGSQRRLRRLVQRPGGTLPQACQAIVDAAATGDARTDHRAVRPARPAVEPVPDTAATGSCPRWPRSSGWCCTRTFRDPSSASTRQPPERPGGPGHAAQHRRPGPRPAEMTTRSRTTASECSRQ